MRRTERQVEIAAPAREAFAALADPDAHLRWRPSCVEFRTVDGGPVRQGARLVEVVRFLGRRYRTIYEVTELEPDRAFAVRSLEGPMEVALRCTVEPAAGGSRVTLAMETATPWLVNWILARYLGSEARRLKRLVESGRLGDAR